MGTSPFKMVSGEDIRNEERAFHFSDASGGIWDFTLTTYMTQGSPPVFESFVELTRAGMSLHSMPLAVFVAVHQAFMPLALTLLDPSELLAAAVAEGLSVLPRPEEPSDKHLMTLGAAGMLRVIEGRSEQLGR